MQVVWAKLAEFMVRWVREHILLYCRITWHSCPCCEGGKQMVMLTTSLALYQSEALVLGRSVCVFFLVDGFCCFPSWKAWETLTLCALAVLKTLFWIVLCSSVNFLKRLFFHFSGAALRQIIVNSLMFELLVTSRFASSIQLFCGLLVLYLLGQNWDQIFRKSS